MRPLKHTFNNLLRIAKVIFLYLLSILLLSFIFSLIYSKYCICDPFQFSVDITWGSPNVPEKLHRIAIFQKLIYEVFLVFLLGTFISQQLNPINPIEYSQYIAYNDKDNNYFFRYWALLSKNKFLFNVTARLVITTQEEINRGINRLSTLFEKQDTYDAIRGVRYFKIEGKDADDFTATINKNNKCVISLYIIGTSELGTTYASVKRFKPTDIKKGYEFVPIRRSEYEKQFNNLKEITSYKQSKPAERTSKEFIRYQHFDKLYKLDGSIDKDKDVLSKKQILSGQYIGPRQWIFDLISWIESFVLSN